MNEAATYIVIVNYGRAEDTLECLASLRNLVEASFKVILIDNASTDNSVDTIHKWIQQTRLSTIASDWIDMPGYKLNFRVSDRNGGFAAGCNIGIVEALRNSDCRYIWLLNNDTIVEPFSLKALVDTIEEDRRIGMCGSTLIYDTPKDTVQACGAAFDLAQGRGGAIGAMISRDQIPSVTDVAPLIDYVVGASMLVSRDFIEQVGLMDERYFLYFEELDWAIRGKQHGFVLGWARESLVVHKEGASIGTSTTSEPSAMSVFFMTASYLRVVYAHRRALLPRAIFNVSGKIVKRLLRRDFVSATATLRGLLDFTRSPAAHKI